MIGNCRRHNSSKVNTGLKSLSEQPCGRAEDQEHIRQRPVTFPRRLRTGNRCDANHGMKGRERVLFCRSRVGNAYGYQGAFQCSDHGACFAVSRAYVSGFGGFDRLRATGEQISSRTSEESTSTRVPPCGLRRHSSPHHKDDVIMGLLVAFGTSAKLITKPPRKPVAAQCSTPAGGGK